MVNLRSLFLLPALSLLPSLASASSVKDLTPSNFDDIVLKSGTPSLVEFFAPWCGHCKTLAPIYEELADSFATSKNVNIAKVDADNHKDLGKRFGVTGFPTLKWFDGKSKEPEDYKGGRDIESLTKFITDKTGLKVKKKGALPSAVVMLDDKSFPTTIGGDKNVVIAFTAPWCGHCKTLAPIWESLARDFESETDLVVAKVDAEDPLSVKTAREQGVTSYPTIKFFPSGESEGSEYKGGRTAAALVKYVNAIGGYHRAIGGALDGKAGRIDALDNILSTLTGKNLEEVTAEVKKASEGLKDKYVEYYAKVLLKLAASQNWANKELARLEGLMKKGGLAGSKQDDLISRINILKKFNIGGRDEL